MSFIYHGTRKSNKISITFDDGPTNGVTDLILDELRARSIRASFFMVGSRILSSPNLAKRVLAEGHEICNHTYNHLQLKGLNDDQIQQELLGTQQVMVEVMGCHTLWFRPPYGALNSTQLEMIEKLGFKVVLWDVDSLDWSQPGEDRIVENIRTQTKSGSIILCHDLYLQTASSTGPVLDLLLRDGFIFETLSGLLV